MRMRGQGTPRRRPAERSHAEHGLVLGPDDPMPEHGFTCGQVVIHRRHPHLGPWWVGPLRTDGRLNILRTCGCGGWQLGDPADFVAASDEQAAGVGRLTGLCPDLDG